MPDLDHRFVEPPFLRICDTRQLPAGSVFTWHLRVAQPNVTIIPTATMHSLEHFLGDYLPQTSSAVLLVAPMGCQTGFYIVATIDAFDEMASALADVLHRVVGATNVPHADVVHCGFADNHSLTGAQNAAAWLLTRRPSWGQVGADARQV